jgi:phosphoglycolate phosphatase
MKIKAVLFDLDGTLLNTIDDIADSANYSLAKFGCPQHTVDAYRYFVGSGVDDLLREILPEDGLPPEKMAAFKKTYVERYGAHSLDKTRPYDGVADMVRELKKIPLKLAVVSNKPDDGAKFTVGRTLEDGLFDVVAGARSGVPLKPDPALARIILDELGLAAAETMFVGDTGVDLATAKNAGCVSVGVTWGFRPVEVKAAGADYIIDSPSELPQLVRNHG